MKEAYNYLTKFISKNDYVVIANSGGPDSMALLSLLLKYRQSVSFNIVCAHINHKVRVESDDEELFVQSYCKSNNVIFECMKIKEYDNSNFEAYARSKRYKFFDDVVHKYNAKVLFTAHHGDDLMETILMRIVRGSSLKGYSGFLMEVNKGSYKLVRPLVYTTKDEIIKYLDDNNIKYVIDKSNYNLEYTRNRYRHNILPYLKKENKNVHLKFLKYSEVLNEYNEYFNRLVSGIIDTVYIDNKLYIDEFKKLDSLVGKRVINYILDKIYGDNILLVTSAHTTRIINMIYNDRPNLCIMLPNNIRVLKNYDKVLFEYVDDSKIEKKILFNEKLENDVSKIKGGIVDKTLCNEYDYKYEFIDILVINNYVVHKVNSEDSDSNYVCRLSLEDIKLPLYVRNRRIGDRIYIMNLDGSKKVKDVFIDSKIDLEKRCSYPIVVDSNDNILWIPGIKKSKYVKKKENKYDIILKYEKIKEEK